MRGRFFPPLLLRLLRGHRPGLAHDLTQDAAMNVAPLEGERHGSAVPMVFMPGSRLYTLRYVNTRRISPACRATNLRKNVNSTNPENPAGLLLTGVTPTEPTPEVPWCPRLLSTAMTPRMSSSMTVPKKPYSTASASGLSSFSTRLNVAPLEGERHGSAVPMVFMHGSRLYTLRYVNTRRISPACRATNLRKNVNSTNPENPAGLLLTGV